MYEQVSRSQSGGSSGRSEFNVATIGWEITETMSLILPDSVNLL